MSSNVKKHLPVLQVLCRCSPKLRKQLLKNADNNLIRSICECCANVLNGNVVLQNHQLKKLKNIKISLDVISTKQKSIKAKKRTIVQSGGSFLLGLIPAAISTILSLLGK